MGGGEGGEASGRTVTMLTEENVVAIFVAKHRITHTARDSLASDLATEYKITSKSVRGNERPLFPQHSLARR